MDPYSVPGFLNIGPAPGISNAAMRNTVEEHGLISLRFSLLYGLNL